VENTDEVHNLFVCTLCSCYPRTILGLPPDWYKGREYRSRVIKEPRAVLKEFGIDIAEDMELRVHDSTADMRYLVLPRRPEGTEGWSEERLAKLVTRDSMIGVSLPLSPDQLDQLEHSGRQQRRDPSLRADFCCGRCRAGLGHRQDLLDRRAVGDLQRRSERPERHIGPRLRQRIRIRSVGV